MPPSNVGWAWRIGYTEAMPLTDNQRKSPHRQVSARNYTTYLERSFEEGRLDEMEEWWQAGVVQSALEDKGGRQFDINRAFRLMKALMEGVARTLPASQSSVWLERCWPVFSSGRDVKMDASHWAGRVVSRLDAVEFLVKSGADPMVNLNQMSIQQREGTNLWALLLESSLSTPLHRGVRQPLNEEGRQRIFKLLDAWWKPSDLSPFLCSHLLTKVTRLALQHMGSPHILKDLNRWQDGLLAIGANPWQANGAFYSWTVALGGMRSEKDPLWHETLAQGLRLTRGVWEMPPKVSVDQWVSLTKSDAFEPMARAMLKKGLSPWVYSDTFRPRDEPRSKSTLMNVLHDEFEKTSMRSGDTSPLLRTENPKLLVWWDLLKQFSAQWGPPDEDWQNSLLDVFGQKLDSRVDIWMALSEIGQWGRLSIPKKLKFRFHNQAMEPWALGLMEKWANQGLAAPMLSLSPADLFLVDKKVGSRFWGSLLFRASPAFVTRLLEQGDALPCSLRPLVWPSHLAFSLPATDVQEQLGRLVRWAGSHVDALFQVPASAHVSYSDPDRLVVRSALTMALKQGRWEAASSIMKTPGVVSTLPYGAVFPENSKVNPKESLAYQQWHAWVSGFDESDWVEEPFTRAQEGGEEPPSVRVFRRLLEEGADPTVGLRMVLGYANFDEQHAVDILMAAGADIRVVDVLKTIREDRKIVHFCRSLSREKALEELLPAVPAAGARSPRL